VSAAISPAERVAEDFAAMRLEPFREIVAHPGRHLGMRHLPPGEAAHSSASSLERGDGRKRSPSQARWIAASSQPSTSSNAARGDAAHRRVSAGVGDAPIHQSSAARWRSNPHRIDMLRDAPAIGRAGEAVPAEPLADDVVAGPRPSSIA